MRFLNTLFCLALLICAMPAGALAQSIDVETRVKTKDAPIVKADKKTDKNAGVLMFKDAGKKPRIVTKTKVRTVIGDKKFVVKNTKKADRFNPQIVGANKLSMQKFNRYAYRKNNSSKPGVPLKQAGGEKQTCKADEKS
jgi:hypothetical protein